MADSQQSKIQARKSRSGKYVQHIPDVGIYANAFQSGAIILYLIEQYDKDNKLSYPSTAEKYLAQQWLFFQVSGQGPYYGQATWFARFHPEKLPSATNRYVDEIIRVTGVLNTALKGREWLVGDKCTYADLSFVTWAKTGEGLLAQLGRSGELEKFADYKAWMGRLEEREVVKEALARIAEVRKAHGLP